MKKREEPIYEKEAEHHPENEGTDIEEMEVFVEEEMEETESLNFGDESSMIELIDDSSSDSTDLLLKDEDTVQSLRFRIQQEAERRKREGNKCKKLTTSFEKCLKGPKTSKVLNMLKEIFNPPLIAGIISIVVGLIAPLQSLFFGQDAPLANSVTLAIKSLGNCCIPMVLVTLGSRLGKGPVHKTNKAVMKGWVYTCTIVFNLLLLPFMISGIVVFMSKYNVIPHDPVMHLAIMFEAAAPTATNVMTLAIYTGNFEQDTVNLLFYSYILAALTFPICSVVFVALCSH